MSGQRRIEVCNSSTLFLFRGRYVTGKSRIWSVKDFNSRVKYIHAKAGIGDPFAAECMRLVERKVEALDEYLDERIIKTESDLAVSGKAYEMHRYKSEGAFEIDSRFCTLGVKACSLLMKIDRYHTSRRLASMAGIPGYLTGLESKQVSKKYNGLKQLPFAGYKDQGIRALEAPGKASEEWISSVRRLGSVPLTEEYTPKYFVRPRCREIEASLNAMLKVEKHMMRTRRTGEQ